MRQVFGRDVDRLVEPSEADQQVDQDLRRQGGVEVVRLGRVELAPEMGDGRVAVLAQEGAEVDAMVLEGPLERRIPLELEPGREPAAVVGQVERPARATAGSVTMERVPDGGREVRDVDVVGLVARRASRGPSTSPAIEVPSGGNG